MEQARQNPYKRVFTALQQTYNDKESIYRDIRDLLAPGTGVFTGDDTFENKRINYLRMLDSEPTTFLDTTVAGLYGGLINPASRWFDLTVDKSSKAYQDLGFYEVAQLTEGIREFLYYLFNKTNFYTAMRGVINEWVRYGIGCMIVEERDWDLMFFNPLTVGEYYLGIDADGKYTKLARCFKMNADQIIQNFGEDKAPARVIEAYRDGRIDQMFEVHHLISPNLKEGLVPSHFKFVDLYWMDDCGCCEGPHYLRKSGFMSNPIVVFAWERKNTRMVYPIGIGEKMLGDVRELQSTVKALNIHKSYLAKPALALHSSLGKKPVLPGAVFYTEQDPSKVASEIYRVNSYIGELEDSRARLLDKIRKMSYAEILLLFAQRDKGQMTAREVTALTNEQMMLLAPVFLQAKSGLEAIFNRVLDICTRRGLLKQMAPNFDIKTLKIEFLSSIAKSQRMAEVGSIQDLISYIGALGQIKPGALDFINEDAIVIDLADRLGNASKINSEERVAELRQQQAEAQQAATELETRAQQAKIAKDEAKAQQTVQKTAQDTNQVNGPLMPLDDGMMGGF